MAKCYALGEKCFVCERDRWFKAGKSISRYFLILGSSSDTGFFGVENKKTKSRQILGCSAKGKHICFACLEVLLKLEDYYDDFFSSFLEDNIAEIRLIAKGLIAKQDESLIKRFVNADFKISENRKILEEIKGGIVYEKV